jgi:hypothetical protein
MDSYRTPDAARGGRAGVTPRAVFCALAVGALCAAGAALGDDPLSRAQLERRQREDAFTLGVQQSMERGRAAALGAHGQGALDARQRDQRQQQDSLFYQQQMQTYTPVSPPFRHAETMRAEQAREDQLSRFRFESTTAPKATPSAPAPVVSPTIGTAPIPRAPADPESVAAMRDARPAQSAPLATIQRVEHDADTLWRAALAGEWNAAQGALGEIRRSIDALRGDRFAADYAQSGGRAVLLSAVLVRLDDSLSGAEIDIGARNADAVMSIANTLMLTAAELVPDITRTPSRQARTQLSPSSPPRAAR